MVVSFWLMLAEIAGHVGNLEVEWGVKLGFKSLGLLSGRLGQVDGR